VRDLMESMVDGERTAREVSDLMEINLGVIERVADRMGEQRLGVPAMPPAPDDLLGYFVKRFFLVMGRPWK
jgi:hypothetical protein